MHWSDENQLKRQHSNEQNAEAPAALVAAGASAFFSANVQGLLAVAAIELRPLEQKPIEKPMLK